MAMATSKISVLLLILALVASCLLTASATDNGLFGSFFLKPAAKPQCSKIYGVNVGDTCLGIAQKFQLTTEFFDSINPNINCDALFVNQWLCVGGKA